MCPLSKFSQDNERVRLICAYCRTSMESGDVLTFCVCVCPQMVKTTGGPAMGGSVSSPALTNAAVTLLQDNLSEEERQLWTSLGPNWTLPRLDFGKRSVFSADINNVLVCLGERAVLKMTFDVYSYSSKKETLWREGVFQNIPKPTIYLYYDNLQKPRLTYIYNSNHSFGYAKTSSTASNTALF